MRRCRRKQGAPRIVNQHPGNNPMKRDTQSAKAAKLIASALNDPNNPNVERGPGYTINRTLANVPREHPVLVGGRVTSVGKGKGRGNWGHKGRPGVRGGSA